MNKTIWIISRAYFVTTNNGEVRFIRNMFLDSFNSFEEYTSQDFNRKVSM